MTEKAVPTRTVRPSRRSVADDRERDRRGRRRERCHADADEVDHAAEVDLVAREHVQEERRHGSDERAQGEYGNETVTPREPHLGLIGGKRTSIECPGV